MRKPCAARQRGGGRPVAAVQRGEGQQAARLRAGAQRLAVLGGTPRRAGVAGPEFFETRAAAALVTRRELAQQAEVALAAAAGVGPFLHGPARRATDRVGGGSASS